MKKDIIVSEINRNKDRDILSGNIKTRKVINFCSKDSLTEGQVKGTLKNLTSIRIFLKNEFIVILFINTLRSLNKFSYNKCRDLFRFKDAKIFLFAMIAVKNSLKLAGFKDLKRVLSFENKRNA